MSWQSIVVEEFLKNRDERFKPDDKKIKNLRRIDKIDFSGQLFLSNKPSNTDMILVKKNDLVISGINVEKGAMCIYNDEEDISATIHYSSYEIDKNKIDIDFLKLFLISPEFKYAIKEQVPGGIKTEIKPKHLLPLKIVIPTSLKEQSRIVEQFNSVNNQIKLFFKEQGYQLELLKKIRRQILQDAIRGKLVKQDPNDEPASKLLEKINAEKEKLIKEKKLKKSKSLPPIKEEEIPFNIPDNWIWSRLENICTKIGSGSTPRGSNYAKEGIPFFRSQNIYDDKLIYEDIKFITKQINLKMMNTMVIANDLLLNITGGSIGRCALVPNDFNNGNVSQHVSIIRPILVDNKFLHAIVLSNYFQNLILKSTTGAGREGLPKFNLEKFLIPVAPYTEQKRIVKKIEELLKVCDELEKEVKQNQTLIQQLLQLALKEALETKVN